jgi:hypothetical protein
VDADLLLIELASFAIDGAQADELKEPHETRRLGKGPGGQDLLEKVHALVDHPRGIFASRRMALMELGIHLNHNRFLSR